jgi:hypothetical protein
MAKKLSKSAPTYRFVQQGKETEIRLKLMEECAPLVEPIVAVTGLVKAAQDKRVAADDALIPIRVKCSLANWEWDKTLRAMSNTADAHAGGKKTAVYKELFPKGIVPLVTPVGEGQRVVAQQFLRHLDNCTTPAARTFLEEWKPKAKSAYDKLAGALTERQNAETALAIARGEEQSARRDFSRTIDRTIALVRSIYPEDRGRQDLVFPSLEEYGSDADEAPETEPVEPQTEPV